MNPHWVDGLKLTHVHFEQNGGRSTGATLAKTRCIQNGGAFQFKMAVGPSIPCAGLRGGLIHAPIVSVHELVFDQGQTVGHFNGGFINAIHIVVSQSSRCWVPALKVSRNVNAKLHADGLIVHVHSECNRDCLCRDGAHPEHRQH